jgi:hypothetical protein
MTVLRLEMQKTSVSSIFYCQPNKLALKEVCPGLLHARALLFLMNLLHPR